MRILIIGGTGAAGSRIMAEATRRGHDVIAASRTPREGMVPKVRLDASDVEAVAAAAHDVDVIIAATRPAAGREADVVDVTTSIASASGRLGVRLLVVGGASPLWVQGTGHIALDDPTFVPPAIRPIAAASKRQLELLRSAGPHVDWTYVAPAADFRPGEARGRCRIHVGDASGAQLVIAEDGTSRVSMEDFALAVCDEFERPRMSRGVISVGW